MRGVGPAALNKPPLETFSPVASQGLLLAGRQDIEDRCLLREEIR
jgi:hypothetical protein